MTPKDEAKEFSIAIPSAPLNGTPVHKYSSVQTDSILHAPPIPEIAFSTRISAERQPIQEIETAPKLPIAAIRVEPSTASNSPNDPRVKIEAANPAKIANVPVPLVSASAENSAPIAETGSLISAVQQPIQEIDTASTLPIVAIRMETSTATDSPNDSPLQTEAASPAKTANILQPFVAASVEDSALITEIALPSAGENTRKDDGKNTTNRASSSMTDRKAGNSTFASLDPVNVETPKAEPIAPPNATQGMPGNASASVAAKMVSADGYTSSSLPSTHVDDGSRGGSAAASNTDAQQQPNLVQTAQLASQAGKSDVRIALQGERFGSVELHAKVNGDQVSASITVEHRETHAMLAGDLPALHQQLNDRQLHVSEILLLHDALSSSDSSGNGPNAKRDRTVPQQLKNSFANAGEGSPSMTGGPTMNSAENTIFDSWGRLSVRA